MFYFIIKISLFYIITKIYIFKIFQNFYKLVINICLTGINNIKININYIFRIYKR